MQLKEYISLFRHRWWFFVLLILLGGLAALAVSLVHPPVFEATTTVLINQAPGALPDADAVLQGQRVAATYAELLHQRPVLEEVVTNLDLEIDPDELDRQISIVPLMDTNLLEVTVRDEDPDLAASIANEIVWVFISQNLEYQESRYSDTLTNLLDEMERTTVDIDKVQAQLDTFNADWTILTPEELAERNQLQVLLSEYRGTYASLLAQYEDVRLAQAQTTDKVTVVESAIPGKRAGLSTPVMTVLGLIVGAVVAAGVILLVEHLDDKINSAKDVSTYAELPTLAIVGVIPSRNGHCNSLVAMIDPHSAVSEAYRVLRARLGFTDTDAPIKSVLVTSGEPLAGKTTTAANLAIVTAQTGKETLLLDLDLRRPQLHTLFELSNDQGVSSALRGEQEYPVMDYVSATRVDNLSILTSGPLPSNPADLLQSEEFFKLMELLEQRFDMIVVDSPPVLSIADSILISQACDSTVLVALAASTKQTVLMAAKQQLVDTGTFLAGVVLNKVKPGRGRDLDRYYYPEQSE